MVQLGVISDVHGNLPALESVFSELDERGVDAVVCLGDLVGVLGWPGEVVSLVRNRTDHTVYGNHDTRILPRRDWVPQRDVEVVEYEQATESLSESDFDWLSNRPGMITVYGNVTLAHSRPHSDAPAGEERGDAGVKPRNFVGVGNDHLDGGTLLIGHAHVQHAVSLDRFDGVDGLVLNPGSVGFPYDGDASFAVVDTETQAYELLTTDYDSEPVVSKLSKNGLLD